MNKREYKKQNKELIGKIIEAANKIEAQQLPKANYIHIPFENIKIIAKEFNISVGEAGMIISEYFNPKK